MMEMIIMIAAAPGLHATLQRAARPPRGVDGPHARRSRSSCEGRRRGVRGQSARRNRRIAR